MSAVVIELDPALIGVRGGRPVDGPTFRFLLRADDGGSVVLADAGDVPDDTDPEVFAEKVAATHNTTYAGSTVPMVFCRRIGAGWVAWHGPWCIECDAVCGRAA